MNTLLNFLISSGMLNMSDTDMVIFMTERKKYLAEHPYKIYQGKDNCWHTYLPDDTKPAGRRHVKRRTQAEVEETVIFYWKDRDDNPTLKEVFDEWLERKLSMNKIKKSTATRYRSDFERYFAGVNTIRGLNFSRVGNSGNASDPVGEAVARVEIFSRHMKMVEQTAIETDPELYSYILRSVTEGCSYVALRTYLGIPCGRDYFYERYRRFFWLLDRARE